MSTKNEKRHLSKAIDYDRDIEPYTQVEQMTGISKSTLVRETRSRKAEALED